MRRLQRFALIALLIALFCAPFALAQDGGTQPSGSERSEEGSDTTTYEGPDTINVDMSDEGGASDDAAAQESVSDDGFTLWPVLIGLVVAVLLVALIAVALAGRDRPPRY